MSRNDGRPAIAALDQSYSFFGMTDACANAPTVAGSALIDTVNPPLTLISTAPTILISDVGPCIP